METMALSYLRHLARNGYFNQAHTDNSWAWLPDEDACRDNQTYAKVRTWLEDNGYIHMCHRPMDDLQAEGVHPKDWFDAWWIEITDKGRASV